MQNGAEAEAAVPRTCPAARRPTSHHLNLVIFINSHHKSAELCSACSQAKLHMRLLNVDTKKLEQFYGAAIPPYAILSHTWGAEEVTFTHLPMPRARLMMGWKKINFTCDQARADGLEWVWVDTCAIDKSSSAELTESINSMFEWYEEAKVCYVYLVDVDSGKEEDTWEAFASSKWWTRGWTLQELLGPSQVEFYDSNWAKLGDKQELADRIFTITRIDLDILKGVTGIYAVSLAKRMSWAATRETTRIEDVAYCLLGLFEINMPLLYGEGTRAFIRLQKEIVAQSSDHSIFAWGFQPVLPDIFQDEGSRGLSGIEKSYTYTGFLAMSPRDFMNSDSIEQLYGFTTERYTITNNGVKIKLPIIRDSGSSIALLGCTIRNEDSSVVGVPVAITESPSSDDSSECERFLFKSDLTGEDGLSSLSVPIWMVSQSELCSLYINTTGERYFYERRTEAMFHYDLLMVTWPHTLEQLGYKLLPLLPFGKYSTTRRRRLGEGNHILEIQQESRGDTKFVATLYNRNVGQCIAIYFEPPDQPVHKWNYHDIPMKLIEFRSGSTDGEVNAWFHNQARKGNTIVSKEFFKGCDNVCELRPSTIDVIFHLSASFKVKTVYNHAVPLLEIEASEQIVCSEDGDEADSSEDDSSEDENQ